MAERWPKHPILRSFESVIRRVDDGPEELAQGQEQSREQLQPEAQAHEHPAEEERPRDQERPKRIIAETGVLLGRKWQRYSDGSFEGETVRGMEPFRDWAQFKSLVEVSPVLRSEFSRPDLEELPLESRLVRDAPSVRPVSAADAATAMAGADAVQPTSTGTPAERAKPGVSLSDARLGRDLVLAGGLGTLFCIGWWFRFYVVADLHFDLLKRGLSEHAIRSTNITLRHTSCFFLNTQSCIATKNWGRFAGYVVYEPAFLWAAICVLTVGFLLTRLQKTAR
jgi:hypothetical protein